MLAAADFRQMLHRNLIHIEDRLRTAGTAGLQLVKGCDILFGQQIRRNGTVDLQCGFALSAFHKGVCQTPNLPAEFRDVAASDGKSGSQLMSAVAFQQGSQGGQRGEQVETAVAAGAGFAMLAVQTDEKCGAGIFLGNAAGLPALQSP